MLVENDSVRTGQIVAPRSFAGLMDLYEHNYMRLRRLAPDLEIADEMISISPGHLDLHLSISERCKYTTMLRLTYQFQQAEGILFQPDMHIRVYHDARIAEVQDRLDRNQQRIVTGNSLELKWKLNRFLYKWLGYCHFQGHCFHPVSNLKPLADKI